MDEPPRSPDEIVVLRPATWREAPPWTDIGRDVRLTVLAIVPPALFVISPDRRDLTVAVALAWIAVAPFLTAWPWIARARERVVVTRQAVELYRWRRRPASRVLRNADLWASRCTPLSWAGRPVAPTFLVMSDGRAGLRLDGPGWVPRHDVLLEALGLDARSVSVDVARRRHPEAFSWLSQQHPAVGVALCLLPVAIGVVAAILI